MPRCFIDHIVVAAPTLDRGTMLVRQALGFAPQAGGTHPRMGTHNRLLRLGDSIYLEVIAPDPGAPSPGRPRWFALDTLGEDAAPVLSTWVARTPDIYASVSAGSENLGNVEPMRRDDLHWRITIPADGLPPLGGVAPALIQWQTADHPAATLEDHGLLLVKLELFHPDPDRIRRLLKSLELADPFSVSPTARGDAPHVVAHIDTPQGFRLLPPPGKRTI